MVAKGHGCGSSGFQVQGAPSNDKPTPETDWRITPLAVEDCDELGRVHMRIWRETYAGIMPAAYLAGLSDDRCAANWRRRLEQPDAAESRAVTLVARDPELALVGFASAGPSRDDDAPTVWELYVVNLVSTVHGSGLADELLDLVLGERDATLWVAEGNARARRFYERRGFVDEGGRDVHEPTGAVEIRLVRRRVAA